MVSFWFKTQAQGPDELSFSFEEVSEQETTVVDKEDGSEMLNLILQFANAGSQVDVEDVLGLAGVEVDNGVQPASGNVPGVNADEGEGCGFFE